MTPEVKAITTIDAALTELMTKAAEAAGVEIDPASVRVIKPRGTRSDIRRLGHARRCIQRALKAIENCRDTSVCGPRAWLKFALADLDAAERRRKYFPAAA